MNDKEYKAYCDYKTDCNSKKLDKLRRLEGKIGIDVITLFDALIGIWVKSTKGEVYYAGCPCLGISENENRELELQFKVGDTWYKVKDYGKTYASTKKELEIDGTIC